MDPNHISHTLLWKYTHIEKAEKQMSNYINLFHSES